MKACRFCQCTYIWYAPTWMHQMPHRPPWSIYPDGYKPRYFILTFEPVPPISSTKHASAGLQMRIKRNCVFLREFKKTDEVHAAFDWLLQPLRARQGFTIGHGWTSSFPSTIRHGEPTPGLEPCPKKRERRLVEEEEEREQVAISHPPHVHKGQVQVRNFCPTLHSLWKKHKVRPSGHDELRGLRYPLLLP
ncbi:hypothetical protein TWF679_008612 [Orbilia oligospora]|uniref:Uncharacterized protein n=1 Tax=Orbilia oligospora TaxID=2813651 RepID=A0A8H8V4P4_ORBOL|nr:hypothetical protein TWF679_008612 [Orbilia oligospora]